MKIVVMGLAILSLCGCAVFLVGAGAVTGYMLSNDAASGYVNTNYYSLWTICQRYFESNHAQILESDESKGVIKVKLNDADVTLVIDTISNKSQHLRVAARKLLLPKPKIAQDVFFEIVKKVK